MTLDLKWIKANPEAFDISLKARGIEPKAAEIVALYDKRHFLDIGVQELNHKRKVIAETIARSTDRVVELRSQAQQINKDIQQMEGDLLQINADIASILDYIPNILDESVPFGSSEADNVLIRSYGDVVQGNGVAKHHSDVASALGMMDFACATKISGSRFALITGMLAKLYRALGNFMLDNNTKVFGFNECSPPYLVKPHAMYNAGQFPKFVEDVFTTTDGYVLIPTSEVSLVNMFSDSIIDYSELPIRVTAHTPCFRSESGSAGRDTKGMIRLHQFHKVELVSITKPQDSMQELEFMVGVAEDILKKLELKYRVIKLCSADTGFSSAITYDIEVWYPEQNQYREVSSCSNCKDFQARRMKTRYRDPGGKIALVHTLNGSSLPIGRILAAIIENYQQEDGSIAVPKCLHDYMDGVAIISKQ